MRAVNLIPREQRRGAGGIAGRSGGIVYVVTGTLVVLVILGAVYGLAVNSVASKKGQLAAITNQVTADTAEASALQPYVEVGQLSAEKQGEVASIAQSRFNWPGAMAQLAYGLPSDVTLVGFSATASNADAAAAQSAAATGNPISPTSFTLTGCAASQGEVATVISDLAQVPGVSDVSLQSTIETITPKKGVRPEAVQGSCPLVTFNATLNYTATYTVPTSNASSTPANAQTASTHGGSATVKTAARQQTTGGSK